MTHATTSPHAARLAALEYAGRRHAENLDGLRRTAAHYQSEIPRFDAEIAKLAESLAHVPPSTDDGVDGRYQIKRRIVELERDRDTVRREGRLLEPQIAEAVALLEENTQAIKTLKAATRL
jgi:chromosome segregation ATPase